MEDVEEKETKREERNAEEIARRKQGAETVTETETAATSGYPLSASSIVVITRKRKLRGSETVGKVVKVGWGEGGNDGAGESYMAGARAEANRGERLGKKRRRSHNAT